MALLAFKCLRFVHRRRQAFALLPGDSLRQRRTLGDVGGVSCSMPA